MPHVKESIEIGASPDEVWSLLGDPARIEEWHPYIASSTLRGVERSCTLMNGGSIEETILDHSDSGRFYVYEITAGMSSLRGYVGRFTVDEHGEGALVHWEGDFEVDDSANEPAVIEQTRQTYRIGLEALRELIETRGTQGSEAA